MLTLREMLTPKRVLILDGAMGTELHRRGADISLPLWSARAIRTHPEVVRQIHLDYLAAGAEIITTNTFRTTKRTFRRAGLADESAVYTAEAVGIAQSAIGTVTDRAVLLAGSMAPLEDCYRPDLVPTEAELLEEHEELATRLANAGVNLLLLETMGTIREAHAACTAACHTGKDVVVSFLCNRTGNLYGNESLEDAVHAIAPLGPTAFSLNCISPRYIDTALDRLQRATRLPICVYANVGRAEDALSGTMVVDISPSAYAEYAARWAEHGVAIIGGCCGTRPEHIAEITTTR
jgi:S-methylmethionine-dependent homocysteine/selenocysteine methylase